MSGKCKALISSMKICLQVVVLGTLAFISCAPAATDDNKALENHARDVYKVLNAAEYEFAVKGIEGRFLEAGDYRLVSYVTQLAGRSCLKKMTLQGYTWPDAPQGTAQCSIKAETDGRMSGFYVLIVGDQSTGNFRYAVGSERPPDIKP